MTYMIIANSLVKIFDDFSAVNEVNLHIKKGECFGLLGPNGAGKSTFINMIYGMVKRSTGSLEIFGHDPNINGRQIKKRLGVVTQDNALDESLTVLENMMIYCGFIGIPKAKRIDRVTELLDYMNLSHKKNDLIQTLSGGMKRRLVFVRALLGNPELLILDEPTAGLDPAVRHLLWGKVRELHKSGTTIVLTTHYMQEAEVLCDRLVILNQGKITAMGTPRELIDEHAPGYIGIFGPEQKESIQKIMKLKNCFLSHEDTSGIYLQSQNLTDLTSMHSEYGLTPLQIRPSNLEDVFLKLTGQELTINA